MATLRKLTPFLFCAALLQACSDPIQHPIIGTWEGNSENIFGLEVNKLTFSDDGTYRWTQSYIGLEETMEHRRPEFDWGEVGYEIAGKFKITEGDLSWYQRKSRCFLLKNPSTTGPRLKRDTNI